VARGYSTAALFARSSTTAALDRREQHGSFIDGKLDLVPAGRRRRHVLPERAAGLGSDTPPPVGQDRGRAQAATRVDQDQPAATPDPARPGPLAPFLAAVSVRYRGVLAYNDGTGRYEDDILPSGLPAGSPEEALDCVCGLYLNDPTGWSLTPDELTARTT
jgi:hypothetical protein